MHDVTQNGFYSWIFRLACSEQNFLHPLNERTVRYAVSSSNDGGGGAESASEAVRSPHTAATNKRHAVIGRRPWLHVRASKRPDNVSYITPRQPSDVNALTTSSLPHIVLTSNSLRLYPFDAHCFAIWVQL